MDSGSAAMVMPTSWLPMFALQASEGQRRGQKYVGATGQMVMNEGQKDAQFFTKAMEPRQITFQCAPVNKMLASISGIADAENGVLFLGDCGYILSLDKETLRLIKELVEQCQRKTQFDRKGNVYVLDAFVQVPKGSKLEQTVERLRNN